MTTAMDRSKLFAYWLLVVVFLVCSCAVPALCSGPLAATAMSDDEDARGEAWIADGAAITAAGGHQSGEVWSRRSLGFRSPGSPPAPLWNNPTTMPVPPPPWV